MKKNIPENLRHVAAMRTMKHEDALKDLEALTEAEIEIRGCSHYTADIFTTVIETQDGVIQYWPNLASAGENPFEFKKIKLNEIIKEIRW